MAFRILRTLTVLVLVPITASAQAKSTYQAPDSAQMANMMARSMKQLKPAELVLGYKDQLALTPEQVGFLQMLVKAQQDSQAVRQERMMGRMMTEATPRSAAVITSMSWSGPVDEAALREQACAQAQRSVDATIGLAHDRHAVGAVLTAEQLRRLPQLESQAMMDAMKRP